MESRQWLPRPIEEVFTFFADAGNLARLTPPSMGFRVLTPTPIELRVGTLSDYRLRVAGVPIRWRARINVWEPPHRFVDEQLRGPYRFWLHEHTFESKDGGTLIGDRVEYAPIGGSLAEKLFVGRTVRRIFEDRRFRLETVFGV